MSRNTSERQAERSDWIERAESVGPTLSQHADASAKAKTLAPESIAALEDAGLFRMASPREVGGFDVHPATQVEAFEQLASREPFQRCCGAMIHAGPSSPVFRASHCPKAPGLETGLRPQLPARCGNPRIPEGIATALPDGTFNLTVRCRSPAVSDTAVGAGQANRASGRRLSSDRGR